MVVSRLSRHSTTRRGTTEIGFRRGGYPRATPPHAPLIMICLCLNRIGVHLCLPARRPAYHVDGSASSCVCVCVCVCVEEIARLHVDRWDAAEHIIDWSKTKNLQPHAIPVPSLAAELIAVDHPERIRLVLPVR